LEYEFQFLIGTVKTRTAKDGRRVEVRFQFLIGTVKTKNRSNIKTGPTVSIPHRYCKNSSKPVRTVYFSFVSIPHRYCKN